MAHLTRSPGGMTGIGPVHVSSRGVRATTKGLRARVPGSSARAAGHPPRHRQLVGLAPAVVLLLVGLAQPQLGALRPDIEVRLLWLLATASVLVAGVVLYFAWRLERAADKAWLCTALVVAGMYGTTEATTSLILVGSPGAWVRVSWVELGLGTLLVVLTCLAPARRFPRGWDPFVVALLVEAVAVTLRANLAPDDRPLASSTAGATPVALEVAVLASVTTASVAVLCLRRLPWALRLSLVGVSAFGVLTAGLAWHDAYDGPVGLRLATAALALACAFTLVGAAVQFLCATQQRASERLLALSLRAHRAEVAHEREEERLHELRATAAGVASASRLLVDPTMSIPESRRRMLSEMVADESERLNRLTAVDQPHRIMPVELDAVVGRVVGKQRALGHQVCWRPGGLVVLADPDDLREVVDVLLVNAERHAPGAVVRVTADVEDGVVALDVTDDGPGIDPRVVDRLFARGARSDSSPGSGLGLHLAARLVRDMGGTLALAPVAATGARFTIRLLGQGGDSHVAREAVHAHHAG